MQTPSSGQPTPQSDFPNDQMTDWVLQGEERPVIRDGEIINEPDDVEENAPLMNAAKSEEKDCWFPIHFSYAGKDYSADVLKTVNEAPEFRVYAVTPAIDRLPEPFIVAYTLAREAVDFPVNETYYPREFGMTLVAAIGTGCNHAEIALS